MPPQSTRLISIYGLVDPTTGDIRYIGQTCHSPRTRLTQHVYTARHATHHTALTQWIAAILDRGARPGVIVLETVPDYQASAVEAILVARYSTQGHALLNMRACPDHAPANQRGIKRRSLEERFWAKVKKTADCWLWTGRLNSSGYGMLFVDGRQVRAHRLSYELSYGPIPEGLQCLHRCEGKYLRSDITCRRCVNPDHLYLGTDRDNTDDKVRAKRCSGNPNGPSVSPERRARGDRHWSRLHPELVARGERNGGGGKLNTEQVLAIWKEISSGRRDWTAIGREFGVAKCTIMRIASGLIWGHVTGLERSP